MTDPEQDRPKPPRALAYAWPLLLVALAHVSVTGSGLRTFLLPAVIFVALPILEALIGSRPDGAAPDELRQRARGKAFTWILRLTSVLVFLELLAILARVESTPRPALEWFGLTLSTGSMLGAVGITMAHELGHRRRRLDRWLAEGLLHASWYPHFHVEHNQGHHVHVATPKDPASARPGESLYAFLVRVMVGSVRSAFEIGGRREVRAGRSPFGPRNPLVRMALVQLAAAGAVAVAFGVHALLFWIAAGFVGALHLEIVDYIEHYGLQRRLLPSGEYEPVAPRHSWNSDHLVGRLFLFELPRHSDHHAQAARPYQALRSLEGAPQMPAGYPAMMLLSLVPPLWSRVMDPRVEAWHSEQPPLPVA